MNNNPINIKTFKLIVEYKGTHYIGFQRQQLFKQSNDDVYKTPKRHRSLAQYQSIQGALEDALMKFVGACTHLYNTKHSHPQHHEDKGEEVMMTIDKFRVRGAGRTDKGVHATGQVVAFDYYYKCYDDNSRNNHNDDDLAASNNNNNNNNNLCISASDIEKLHGTVLLQRAACSSSSMMGDKNSNLLCSVIAKKLNAYLPSDIVIRQVELVSDSMCPFEPRQAVKLKQYLYYIRFIPDRKRAKSSMNGNTLLYGIHSFRRAVFLDNNNSPSNDFCWDCPWVLDTNKLMNTCSTFIGKYDFTCFVHKEDRNTNSNDNNQMNLVDLLNFNITFLQGDNAAAAAAITAKFTVEAQGFKRGMVRRLVGFVVDIARGKVMEEAIPAVVFKDVVKREALDSKEIKRRCSLVNSAPAHGLVLSKVLY